MKKSSLSAAAIMAAIFVATPAHAERIPNVDDWGFSLSTGIDYSSGDYGQTEKTEILVVPLSARVKAGWIRLSATLPYLRIDSPGGVVIGPDGTPLPGVPTASGVREGLGDLSLAATASLPPAMLGGLHIDLTGRVKLPTSKDSDGLGTGETDYTVAADISYPIGNIAPFVTIGYRMPGDPEGFELRNSIRTSVGTSVVLGRMVAIASYDYARASSPLAEDAHELFGALNGPLNKQLNWTLYGIAGMSEGSPDAGVGALITFKFN
jgi:hypothetical protein